MTAENSYIYILHGDANLLIEETLAKLLEELSPPTNVDFNFDVFDGEVVDISHVLAAANTLPVFAERRIVVARRAEKYLENKKSDNEVEEDSEEVKEEEISIKALDDTEKVLRYAADPNPHAIVIFVASRKLDARRKSFKELTKAAKIYSLNEPQYKDAASWVSERVKQKYAKKISFDASQYLIAAVGRNSALLSSELEKLALYCADKKEISLEDVKLLTAEESNVVVFDFIDALIEKRPQKALDILQELIRRGEYPAKILVVLASQLRSLISVKALKERGLNPAEISKALGKGDFIIRKYLRQEKHFSMSSLVNAMRYLTEADAKTKMAGAMHSSC